MADELRPRLERVLEVSKQLNAATDSIGRVVQGVELYLDETCNLGIEAEIVIDTDNDEESDWSYYKWLCYGHYNDRFRIFLKSAIREHPEPTFRLWGNCSRDDKVLAYEKLPELIDRLIALTEAKLAKIQQETLAIEAILPAPKSKKKGAEA